MRTQTTPTVGLGTVGKFINLLSENIEILKAVANELLEKETIMLEDLDRIIEEHKSGGDFVPDQSGNGQPPVEPAQE